jgi:predicted porin
MEIVAMKKSLLALAALTAFAGAASAQSSVTLFGVLDLNVRHIKNNDTLTIMSQDGIASSRLGFRGVEDIGGGLRAGFWLEADFWNHTFFDPFGTNGVGSSVNAFGTFNGATTLVRANNSIGYFLPSMSGFGGQVMLSAGEGQVNQGNKHFAGRLTYAAGPLSAGIAYGKTDAGPLGDWTRFNVAGSYTMGAARLMAQYNQGEGSGGADNGKKQTLWLLGAVVPMGAHTFKASYVNSNSSGTGIDARDANQIALGYQYDMSKRTALYGNFARVSNDAGAAYTAGGGGSTLTAGKDSTGMEVGIRHTF